MCIETSEIVQPKPVTSNMNKSVLSDKCEQDNGDGLRIRRIAGGCMINRPPLFSSDGDVIYVIWDRVVRAFSVTTGEVVRDYDGTDDDIFGILIDRNNRKLLYGCTHNGLILSWNVDSGVLHGKREILQNTKLQVNHFSILYDENDVATFLISGQSSKKLILIYCPAKQKILQSFSLDGKVNSTKIILASGGDKLNFFAFITDSLWHWAVIKPEIRITTRKHCNDVPPRVVACHPTQDIVAVGDNIGRVVLYKNFLKTAQAVPETYHWHANPVQCVTFSHTGTHFYSGGLERVLVKWTVGDQANKEMLPRLSDSVVQIAVAPENVRLALCTADNGIQILNALQKKTATVQSFSRISDDYTGRNPFPIGIRVNPRTQTMILNGRIGCIQFFSTYSRSLLYTLDITLKNYNTVEQKKVIYNTVVTKVAVNSCWLATVETWNDNRYSTETRLKLWRYDESRQNYTLNTNVENVHQDGVNGLEFSSSIKEKNLLCATAGKDRCVKVWSVEEIEITGGGEKLVWVCVGRVDYKNFPVQAISFSQDGSLLAAGFGNVLCAWSAETLRLKCVLSAPAGYDGGVNRVVLSVPNKKKTISKNEYMEKRSKIIQQMLEVLEKKDATALFKNAKAKKKDRLVKNNTNQVEKLSLDEKKHAFKRVQQHNELSLLQKAELFYRLGIQCKTTEQMKQKIEKKLTKAKNISTQAENHLQKAINELCTDVKFRSKRKLHCYQRRKAFNPGLAQFTSLFDGGKKQQSSKQPQESYNQQPIKTVAYVKHVLFCHGEYSHLVVMCTESRLLVWNLLTLRIQVTVNLSVEMIVIDSFTNLIAAFTSDKELYIFLPNIPMPLYHRKDLPTVYGSAWIPRRYPKSQSLNVDWQAVSQLYFLNQNQELLHLVSDSDEESLGPVVYMSEVLGKGLPNTPFAAMLTKQTSGVQPSANVNTSVGPIGVAGRSSVKEIASTAAHTMAPISLLCRDFLKSLLIVEKRRRERDLLAVVDGTAATTATSRAVSDDDDATESDSESSQTAEVSAKIAHRKVALESIERAKLKPANRAGQLDQDSKLRKLLEDNVDIEF
ncbi:WD repeat-containing protein 75 [Topomyia yanbarensis]|uniref:WD repeat-containing protein 75 n=1 Tax=Topomyia yanbarensis TaxID=2498891 RepID=UPI00273B297F|nr:WD repeat-containing protein 75 [Topomyia yanbarensis]